MVAITEKAWNGSASRWPDTASFCDACLINENTGDRKDWTQSQCKLPVREPNGDINSNAVHAAASALAGGRGGVKASPQAKKAAARTLVRIYEQLKEDAPDSLKNIAR